MKEITLSAGLMSLIMGSETERVLHRTSIPVLLFRALMSADHPDNMAPGRKGELPRSATEEAKGFGGLHWFDPRAGSRREKDGYY